MDGAEETLTLAVTSDRRWSDRAESLARRALFDTLAVGIGGTASEQARIARTTIAPAAPGKGDRSALWNDPTEHHVADAAYVAGTSAHSVDWDDYMHPMHGHSSAVLLGALFPLAEAVDADGQALIDAYLTGYQVDWLVSLALSHSHYSRGWHATSTIGVLGAAAGASKLLGLDPREIRHALGVAASSAAGIRVNFGTTTKALHAGSAARSGVQAAFLARAGATSSPHWLTGVAGVMQTLGAEHKPDEAARILAAGAAEQHHGIETAWGLVQKPYACCGSIHGAIHATLTVLDQDNIGSGDIEQIIAHVDPLVTGIMRYQRPDDPHQARYSPTWALAAAAVDRAAGPGQFSADAVSRADIHNFRERVHVLPDLVVDHDERFGAEVEVRTRSGVVVHRVSEAPGHPRRPMSDEDLDRKALAALELASTRENAIALLTHLRGVGKGPVRELGAAIRDALGRPPRA